MDEKLAGWLGREAKSLRVSKSRIVREALEMRMNQGRGKSCFDLAADLYGSVRSDVRDLSTNKKYLKGLGRS